MSSNQIMGHVWVKIEIRNGHWTRILCLCYPLKLDIANKLPNHDHFIIQHLTVVATNMWRTVNLS